MASGFDKKAIGPSSIELEQQNTGHDDKIFFDQKIAHGDDALKIFHTHYEPFTKEEEKAVLKKIDRRLVFLMFVVNGLQFVDKTTISAAATYGIIDEAHLVGQEFSLLISLFYIGYLVAQYPTNYLMQRFPIGKYITINFILWGATLAATASATNFATLAASRFFLGVFESCLNPGFIIITSSWWRREEQTSRIGLWYFANGVIGGPAGLVFWGIAHINVGNMFPYQWMFMIFGLVTVLFGISLWWLLPDSPLTATFFTERERLIAVERLKDNKTGLKNSEHKKEQVIEALTDPKVWMLSIAVFLHNMTNSLQSNFTGLIIKGFGYGTYEAVLLSIPGGFIFAAIMVITSFYLSSRWGDGKRIIVIIICYIPGIVACVLLHTLKREPQNKGALLFALFILPTVAAAGGITYSLLASNVAGYTKKTVAGSMFFSCYCIANIVSPQTFLAKEAPTYNTGVAVTLASFCANIVLFSVLLFVYRRSNSTRDKAAGGDHATAIDANQELVAAFSDLTDLENKTMRYKL